MGIGERIKTLRRRHGYTLEELGQLCGVGKSTVRKWENGLISDIRQSNLAKLANALGSTPEALMGWDEDEEKTRLLAEEVRFIEKIQNQYGKQAVELLQAFAELNAGGKSRAVEAVIELSEIQRFQKSPAVPMRSIPVFHSPAAAGTPLYAESEYDYVDFPVTEIPEGADFGVRISGESMQPTIENGSIVFVEKTLDLQSGEIGVFMLGDSAVCKRLRLNAQGRVVALQSDNPDYPSITGYDLEGFRVVGKVLL